VQVIREAGRADAFEERFREELNLRGLKGEWHIVDHTDLAELTELAETADLAIRVGLAPTGKRRLITAHTQLGRRGDAGTAKCTSSFGPGRLAQFPPRRPNYV
jgi:hypothetical protein